MARKKGDQYKCDECGLVIVIEDPCGCEEDACELVCCSEPMKPVSQKTEKPKTSAKPAK